MNQLTQHQLDSLRLTLALQAIAEREGVSFLEVLDHAGEDPAAFVRQWITDHYFDTGGF